jgi:hypothetical protein
VLKALRSIAPIACAGGNFKVVDTTGKQGIQAMNDDRALEQRFLDRAKALSNVAEVSAFQRYLSQDRLRCWPGYWRNRKPAMYLGKRGPRNMSSPERAISFGM